MKMILYRCLRGEATSQSPPAPKPFWQAHNARPELPEKQNASYFSPIKGQ